MTSGATSRIAEVIKQLNALAPHADQSASDPVVVRALAAVEESSQQLFAALSLIEETRRVAEEERRNPPQESKPFALGFRTR